MGGSTTALTPLTTLCSSAKASRLCNSRNMHDIAPHGVTAAEALISLSAVIQEGSPED